MKKIPLNVRTAITTIKEFCERQLNNKVDNYTENCKNCPFNFTDGYDNECFFAALPPNHWEVEK